MNSNENVVETSINQAKSLGTGDETKELIKKSGKEAESKEIVSKEKKAIRPKQIKQASDLFHKKKSKAVKFSVPSEQQILGETDTPPEPVKSAEFVITDEEPKSIVLPEKLQVQAEQPKPEKSAWKLPTVVEEKVKVTDDIVEISRSDAKAGQVQPKKLGTSRRHKVRGKDITEMIFGDSLSTVPVVIDDETKRERAKLDLRLNRLAEVNDHDIFWLKNKVNDVTILNYVLTKPGDFNTSGLFIKLVNVPNIHDRDMLLADPTWICLRPDLRPNLQTTNEIYMQSRHSAWVSRPKHVDFSTLVGVLRHYNQVLSPRYPAYNIITQRIWPTIQTTNFQSFEDVTLVDECVTLYDIALKLAAGVYAPVVKKQDADCLWKAVSLYLGFLIYPWSSLLYPMNMALELLGLSDQILSLLESLGSYLLWSMCCSQEQIRPRFNIKPSWFGILFKQFYGYKPKPSAQSIAIEFPGFIQSTIPRSNIDISEFKDDPNCLMFVERKEKVPRDQRASKKNFDMIKPIRKGKQLKSTGIDNPDPGSKDLEVVPQNQPTRADKAQSKRKQKKKEKSDKGPVAQVMVGFAMDVSPIKKSFKTVAGSTSGSQYKSFATNNNPAYQEYKNLHARLTTLPSPPFENLTYLYYSKTTSIYSQIENQLQAASQDNWVGKVKDWDDKAQALMIETINQKPTAFFMAPVANVVKRVSLNFVTTDKVQSDAMERSLHLILDKDRRVVETAHMEVGRTYVNSVQCEVTEGINGYNNHIVIDMICPTLKFANGDNGYHKEIARFKPSQITTKSFQINTNMLMDISVSPNRFTSPYIGVFKGIKKIEVLSLIEQRKDFLKTVEQYCRCPATPCAQLCRFILCQRCRFLTVPSDKDQKWIKPIEYLRFKPMFDVRTMTGADFIRIYNIHPAIKVNMHASTGYFTHSQPRNLAAKITDSFLFSTFYDNIADPDMQEFALQTQLKPKDEIIKKPDVWKKGRSINVTNSFTQIALNVLFTGAEEHFMRITKKNPLKPVLLGCDPPTWIKDIIDYSKNHREKFTQRYYYFSYSDNVYCLDTQEMLLYSFDGKKMESSVRGQNMVDALESLTSYTYRVSFTVQSSTDLSCLIRDTKYDIPHYSAYRFHFDGVKSWCYTPMAIDGKTLDITDPIAREELNRVIVYSKTGEMPYVENEGTYQFECYGMNNNQKVESWNTYRSLMGRLCESLTTVLGIRVFKAHFLPSGVQPTAILNTWMTLGTVLWCNKTQQDPTKFIEVPKCWIATLENVADLKPLINDLDMPNYIKLDFLGLDAIKSLGYWSLVLRKGNLFSGPLYSSYVTKGNNHNAQIVEFATTLSAILNGAFNYPYYFMILLSRLTMLVNKVTIDKRQIEEVFEQETGTTIDIPPDVFKNTEGFWKKFIELCVKRLYISGPNISEVLGDNISNMLVNPSVEEKTIQDFRVMLQDKYKLLGNSDIVSDIMMLEENESITRQVAKNANSENMNRLAAAVGLLAEMYNVFDYVILNTWLGLIESNELALNQFEKEDAKSALVQLVLTAAM